MTSFTDVLAACPLFSGCGENEILSVLKKSQGMVEHFPAGEEILTYENGQNRLGILLSGKVSVLSLGEKGTVLNRLEPSKIFGVSAFFGSAGAKTRLLCDKECKVLFISEEEAEPLWQNPRIRKNLISFLTDRICFLNQKIATFTQGDAKECLRQYLLEKSDTDGKVIISPSYASLAKELNLGRASLYRALDELTSEGFITKEKKEIVIQTKEKTDHIF